MKVREAEDRGNEVRMGPSKRVHCCGGEHVQRKKKMGNIFVDNRCITGGTGISVACSRHIYCREWAEAHALRCKVNQGCAQIGRMTSQCNLLMSLCTTMYMKADPLGAVRSGL